MCNHLIDSRTVLNIPFSLLHYFTQQETTTPSSLRRLETTKIEWVCLPPPQLWCWWYHLLFNDKNRLPISILLPSPPRLPLSQRLLLLSTTYLIMIISSKKSPPQHLYPSPSVFPKQIVVTESSMNAILLHIACHHCGEAFPLFRFCCWTMWTMADGMPSPLLHEHLNRRRNATIASLLAHQ